MTSSKIFEKRDFLGDKERKIRSWGSGLAQNQDFAKGEGPKPQVKSFTNLSKLEEVVSKLVQLECITDGTWGGAASAMRTWGDAPSSRAIFCKLLKK